ncbi:CwfJ C-terminus 1-domain-containing protein-like protein [Myxozyma melibiosi]|uniref:CwfJ C-terminus 1-domain-containing protein-like protein n=1 Tax=Myxozyma melibiosi TaxID=54550 RepID=A0ABR1FAM6_9ASCO
MSKILVFGSAGKNFKPAIAKAAQINSSPAGPFDALLLLGDAFTHDTPENDIDDLLAGRIEIAFPTYFYSHDHLPVKIRNALESSKNGQICRNLICFGGSGALTTDKGVKIAAVGPGSSIFEIEKLKSQKSVDIFVSAHWPEHITLLSPGATEAVKSVKTDSRITDLVSLLQPRYHFSPGKLFWEREPYRNEGYINLDGGGGERPTKFISLAPLGNPEKSKWFYAFSVSVPYIPLPLPDNATANPYIEGAKLKAAQKPAETRREAIVEDDEDDDEEMIYGSGRRASKRKADDDGDNKFSRRDTKRRGQNSRPQRKPVDASSCFFCLSNPQLAQHFIVSIGEESYVTTAKGPLPKPESKGLACPGHVLIIPLEHQPTVASISDPGTRERLLAEMSKFRARIAEAYAEHGYGAVAFEISRERGIHFHIQVIPVPTEKLDRVEQEFRTAADANGYTIEKHDSKDAESESDGDYFKVYLPDNSSLYVPLSPETRFDLQFGRKVLATVLELPDRVDWRTCAQDEKEEVKDAERFKEVFSKYDFTIEE